MGKVQIFKNDPPLLRCTPRWLGPLTRSQKRNSPCFFVQYSPWTLAPPIATFSNDRRYWAIWGGHRLQRGRGFSVATLPNVADSLCHAYFAAKSTRSASYQAAWFVFFFILDPFSLSDVIIFRLCLPLFHYNMSVGHKPVNGLCLLGRIWKTKKLSLFCADFEPVIFFPSFYKIQVQVWTNLGSFLNSGWNDFLSSFNFEIPFGQDPATRLFFIIFFLFIFLFIKSLSPSSMHLP